MARLNNYLYNEFKKFSLSILMQLSKSWKMTYLYSYVERTFSRVCLRQRNRALLKSLWQHCKLQFFCILWTSKMRKLEFSHPVKINHISVQRAVKFFTPHSICDTRFPRVAIHPIRGDKLHFRTLYENIL